jgi:hypothetical protein
MSNTAVQVSQPLDLQRTDPDPITWLSANQDTYKKFTPKQKAFLNAYILQPSVRACCEKVKVSPTAFYAWMHKSKDYRMAFEAVKKMGIQTLEDEVVRRALTGVEEPVFNKEGKQVGSRTKYSDSLLMFYLNGNAPEKYKQRNTHEHSGPNGGPMLTVSLLDDLVKD